jgi:hypothetical protein
MTRNHATTQSGQHNIHSRAIEKDNNFYDANDLAVFGVDTNASNLLAHVPDFTSPGNTTARHHNSSCIPHDEWLQLFTEKREEFLAKRHMELGHPSNGNWQHRLPASSVNAHDFRNVVNLNELIEFSTKTHMTKNRFSSTWRHPQSPGCSARLHCP